MAYRKLKVGKGSVTTHILVDNKAWIFKPENKWMRDIMGCVPVVVRKAGVLAIEKGYAIPNGYGRSVRAAVLGLEYKCARRKAGTRDQFATSLLNYPQNSSGLIKRMKEKGLV